jgi:hypothetical protein
MDESQAVYLNQLPRFSIDNAITSIYGANTFSENTCIAKYFNGVTVMNALTKLAINKKISAIFADGTSKLNLGVSTVVGLLSGVDRVAVEVAPFSRSTKLLADLAESSGRQVTQNDGDGTLLVRPAVVAEPVAEDAIAGLVAAVEPESVAWPDMTDEQRVEVIADDKVEVEQIASVEQVAEAPEPEPESEAVVEQVAQAFHELAPKARASKAKVTKPKKAPTVKKYATLGTIFFSGSSTGQLLSVFKAREVNPLKVSDYRAALAAGDCRLPEEPLTKSLKEKIVALGLEETV